MSERTTKVGVLTQEQGRNLRILLDMIIPPNPARGMPGAGELDLVGYLTEFQPDQIEAIRTELDQLSQEARAHFHRGFAELEQGDRDRLVARLRAETEQFAKNIVVETMACYYQDDRVVLALGMEARPPFPKGHEVDSGDLSLLDPVRERKPLYRDDRDV